VRGRFFNGRRFKDLFDLNAQVAERLDQSANSREHETTGKVPSLVFELTRRCGALPPSAPSPPPARSALRARARVRGSIASPAAKRGRASGGIKTYDEWGNVLQFTSSTGSWPIAFGFAGGLYDEDTKFVRFGVRDYDPVVGRWTSKGPILFDWKQASLNMYVNNDPLSL
jgi:RHS repeat-associated protein